MATNVENREQWTSNDYIHYFSNSSRFKGVAESFTGIASLMDQLHELDQQPISHDMAMERGKLLDQIMEEASKYASSHKDARSTDGIRRREVMEALTEFCNKEKRYTSLDANIRYFRGKTVQDIRKGITRDDFVEIEKEFSELEYETMTEERVIQYTNVVTRYVQAAESYMNAHPNAKKGMDPKTLAEVYIMNGGAKNNPYDYAWAIVNDYKPFLDSARDMKKVRALIDNGKSWGDLRALRNAHHVITGKTEVVGNEASQRIKTTVNGMPGFFTKESRYKKTSVDGFREYAKGLDSETAKIITDNLGLLNIGMNENTLIKSALLNNHFVKYHMYESWFKETDPYKKESKVSFLRSVSNTKENNELTGVIEHYIKKVHALGENAAIEQKKRAYMESVAGNVKDKTLASQYLLHADMIMQGCDSIKELQELTKSVQNKAKINFDLMLFNKTIGINTKTPEGVEAFQNATQLIGNERIKKQLIDEYNLVSGTAVNRSLGRMDENDNPEMTGRNVLSSRIAELLGVGNLIAHAEKMTVEINGKTVTGCFMDKAQGINVGEAAELSELDEVMTIDSDTLTPGLARDASSLNLLDVICAQYDRHEKNFFQILGPVKENGKRDIIGLQGIDNDQSFSRKSITEKIGLINNGKGSGLNGIKFVDDELAKKLLDLDRSKVEYAVGDILTEHEIDGFMDRLETVKSYIKEEKIIRLNGDKEWDITNYKDPQTAQEKKIAEGFQATMLNKEKINQPFEMLKSNVAIVQSAVIKAGKRYVAAKQKAMEEQSAVKSSKAAVFDKIVAKKSESQQKPQTQAASIEGKTVNTPVLTSAKELMKKEQMQKTGKGGFLSGLKKEKNAKKELDLGFTEITKEDIKQANRNVKKPIIGGHRGPKK